MTPGLDAQGRSHHLCAMAGKHQAITSGRASADSARLLDQLKRVFQSAGLRYADVAQRIGVSEKTMKRYMAGRGLTLATLEQICAAVEIDLFELAELAASAEPAPIPYLTPEQEQAMGQVSVSSFIFYLLTKGWSVDCIAVNLQLTESEIIYQLTQLDKIGVITLYPGNRVKIRVRMRSFNRESEEMSRGMRERWDRLVEDLDLDAPSTIWRSGITRLSPESFSRAGDLFNNFITQLFSLGEKDRDLPPGQARWYATGALMREEDIVGEVQKHSLSPLLGRMAGAGRGAGKGPPHEPIRDGK